jgi:tripartite-type tricarboxylate transporter receptor subunit TctC
MSTNHYTTIRHYNHLWKILMTITCRLRPAAILALAFTFGCWAAAWAQPYPSKPVHIVVPFAAGGITDVIGRALGQRLAEAWGQQVVIENRPGGGTGQVGTDYVAKSAPDGSTLLVTADATFVTAPHTYSKLPYDAIRDFVPITALGISPQALVVHPSLPVRTLADLVELAKKKPGEINYGTFGIGSSGHLNIILLEGMTGTRFTPVHYRGAAPAITDLIGGHIQMMIVSIGLVRQSWQAGGLKVLGFGSTARIAQYPDVPTLAESGLPGYEAGSWYALAAPKGTPRDIVMKLNGETQRIFDDPAFQQKFLAPNFIFPMVSSPEAFAERIHTESAKWGKVIRDANVKVE